MNRNYVIKFTQNCNKSTKDKKLCERIWNELLLAKYPNFEQREKWIQLYKIYFKCVEDNNYVWSKIVFSLKSWGEKGFLKMIDLQ